MPLSVVYINVDGQPMSEIRGGVVTEYVHDPLGNLIATNTSVGIVTWTGDYWPYGESMISSGSKANNWGFCAAWGYYDDGNDNSYVRRRVLRRKWARWQTVDPLWPAEPAFAYTNLAPTQSVDPSGLRCAPCSDLLKSTPGVVANRLRKCVADLNYTPEAIQYCLELYRDILEPDFADDVRKYIACVIAARLDPRTQGPPPCNPCAPGMVERVALNCCYRKFLKCMFDCRMNKFSSWAWCVGICKPKFEKCLADHCFDEAAGAALVPW